MRKVNRSAKTIATDKRNKAPIISDKHKFITPDQKLDLFLALENKSQKEVDKILAGHFPEEVKVAEKIRPVSEKHSEVRFVAEDQLLKKLEKVKSLLSHKNPNPTMAELLLLMADFVIAKKDPIVKKMKATLADSSAPPTSASEGSAHETKKSALCCGPYQA